MMAGRDTDGQTILVRSLTRIWRREDNCIAEVCREHIRKGKGGRKKEKEMREQRTGRVQVWAKLAAVFTDLLNEHCNA